MGLETLLKASPRKARRTVQQLESFDGNPRYYRSYAYEVTCRYLGIMTLRVILGERPENLEKREQFFSIAVLTQTPVSVDDYLEEAASRYRDASFCAQIDDARELLRLYLKEAEKGWYVMRDRKNLMLTIEGVKRHFEDFWRTR